MACTSDIDPARFTGDERSTSTFTPTSTSWVAMPPSAHAAATSPTVGARPTPTSTTIPAAAPSSTLRCGPTRSAPAPPGRAGAMPATPQAGEHEAALGRGESEDVLEAQ